MTEEQKEQLGQLIDSIDNLSHGLETPMPPAYHISLLQRYLPKKVHELKKLYQEITGENPWE